jgi:hypothetical protein
MNHLIEKKGISQPCQLSKKELQIINESLRFMISCLDHEQANLYQDMKLVLEKVEHMLEQ